jgi:hypothetical protein
MGLASANVFVVAMRMSYLTTEDVQNLHTVIEAV